MREWRNRSFSSDNPVPELKYVCGRGAVEDQRPAQAGDRLANDPPEEEDDEDGRIIWLSQECSGIASSPVGSGMCEGAVNGDVYLVGRIVQDDLESIIDARAQRGLREGPLAAVHAVFDVAKLCRGGTAKSRGTSWTTYLTCDWVCFY